MPTFMQYSLAATKEALEDARWQPETQEELERTVSKALAQEH